MRRVPFIPSVPFVFLFFSLLTGFVFGQSLGDVAQKEKKRREVNRERGIDVKAFDLAGTPVVRKVSTGDSLIEKRSDEADRDDEPLDDDIAAIRGYATERGSNDGWDVTFSAYLKRFRDVANRIDQLRVEEQSICSELEPPSSGNTFPGSETGQVVIVPTDQQNRCSTLPGEITRLELERKQIERDCAEDARRRGVLPGRARLVR